MTPNEAAERVANLDNSWWGVLGPFIELSHEARMKVSVDSFTIGRVIESQPGFVPDKLVTVTELPGSVEGWLGTLSVVEIDPNLPNGTAGWLGTHVVAAELHHAPDVGRLAYVAVSVPHKSGSFLHDPTIFQGVSELGQE